MIPGMHRYKPAPVVTETASDRLNAAIAAHNAAQKPRIVWVNGKAMLAPK